MVFFGNRRDMQVSVSRNQIYFHMCGNYRKAFLYIVTYVKSGKKEKQQLQKYQKFSNSEGHSTDINWFSVGSWRSQYRYLGNYYRDIEHHFKQYKH